MDIPLRLVEPPPWRGPDEPRQYEVGDCWHASRGPCGWYAFADGPEWSRHLLAVAPEHERDGARPMMVVLTDKRPPWCLHAGTTRDGSGWTVTGDLPLVSVSPSINMVGDWHGWVRGGRLVGR